MLAEQQAGINLTGTESWHVEIMLSTRQRTYKPQQLQLTGLYQTQVTTCQNTPLPLLTEQIEIHFQIPQNWNYKPYAEAVISMFFLHGLFVGFKPMCLLGNIIMYNREFLFDLP